MTSIPALQRLMRSNDFHNDPYSHGNPFNAICSRGDLANPPHTGGCYDTKVSPVGCPPARGGAVDAVSLANR